MQWREERTGPRKIALRLCNTGLLRKRVDVIRNNIEHLIKFPQRFRETTNISYRIARVG